MLDGKNNLFCECKGCKERKVIYKDGLCRKCYTKSIVKTSNTKPKEEDMKLLDIVNDLIYSERAKQYGSFKDNMSKVSNIFYELTNKRLTEEECGFFLVALKLAREGTKHKRDNLVDAVGYLALIDDMRDRK